MRFRIALGAGVPPPEPKATGGVCACTSGCTTVFSLIGWDTPVPPLAVGGTSQGFAACGVGCTTELWRWYAIGARTCERDQAASPRPVQGLLDTILGAVEGAGNLTDALPGRV